MNKKLLSIITISLLIIGVTGCFKQEADPVVEELKNKVEQLEEENLEREQSLLRAKEEALEAELKAKEEAELKEKTELKKEVEELKKENAKKPKVIVQQPVVAKITRGPGNANNWQGDNQGKVSVVTKSINSSVSLRPNPNTSDKAILKISNGTVLKYWNRTAKEDFIWYEVEYKKSNGSYIYGFIRGDYLNRI